MTKIQTKRMSIILTLFVITFAITAPKLQIHFQIDIFHYTTPVVVGFAIMCILGGLLFRFFSWYLENNPICFSFGQQESLSQAILIPATPQIQEQPVTINQTTNNERVATGNSNHSFFDDYEEMQEQLLNREAQRRIDAMEAVYEYTMKVTAGHLSKEALATLLSNIKYLACKQTDKYQKIRSNIDNPLKSPDLRHLAWNIGERLGATIEERAVFIKSSFPIELENATIEYLQRNLRDCVSSKIHIDVPDKGDYHFHIPKE